GAGRLVHRRVHGAATAVQLEGGGAEATYDEIPGSVGRTIEIALLIGSQVVAGDHDPVWMRMGVQVHVLGLIERRLHGVVARRLVGGIPIGDGGAGGDVQRVAVFGEL